MKVTTESVKSVIIPIPSYGFDPTEVAIPWKILTQNNIKCSFSTPNGQIARADDLMLKGKNLGLWKPLLKARNDTIVAYHEMQQSQEFTKPIKYNNLTGSDFDAIYLPGGHDKGVKEYLESKTLQRLIVDFFNAQKPVTAVCHGVLLVARSVNAKTKQSVLYDYKTTSLLKSQELLAYQMTRLWLKDYYLTYPETTVEDEVKSYLSNQENFITGPTPLFRDSENSLKRGFFVRDRNFLSARWPGDIYKFTSEFLSMLT